MIIRSIIAILFLATTAQAQAEQAPNEVRMTSGVGGFVDEATDYHFLIGGAYRRYVTRSISIEPEFTYMIGSGSDRDISVIAHVAYDFRAGQNVRPYLTLGAGVLHQRVRFPVAGLFTSNETTVSGGLGVKFFVTPKIFFAPEFRLGHEPLYRATGSVGFVF